MYSRTAINDMLTELAADMPRMLRDVDTFFRQFEDRAKHILAAAAPEDEAYVRAVLQEFADRASINERWIVRYAG